MLGHEATGVIVKVGSNVKNLKEGDDVLISWIPFDATKDTDYLQWCDIGWGRKKLKSILFTWSEHTIIHKQFVSPLPKGFEKYSADCEELSESDRILHRELEENAKEARIIMEKSLRKVIKENV